MQVQYRFAQSLPIPGNVGKRPLGDATRRLDGGGGQCLWIGGLGELLIKGALRLYYRECMDEVGEGRAVSTWHQNLQKEGAKMQKGPTDKLQIEGSRKGKGALFILFGYDSEASIHALLIFAMASSRSSY